MPHGDDSEEGGHHPAHPISSELPPHDVKRKLHKPRFETVMVTFRVKCDLAKDKKHQQYDEIRLVGSEEELGTWNVSRALKMEPVHNDNKVASANNLASTKVTYRCCVQLPVGGPVVQYKYVLTKSRQFIAGKQEAAASKAVLIDAHWENLTENRSLNPSHLAKPHPSSVLLVNDGEFDSVEKRSESLVVESDVGTCKCLSSDDDEPQPSAKAQPNVPALHIQPSTSFGKHNPLTAKLSSSLTGISPLFGGQRSISVIPGATRALIVVLYRLPIIATKDRMTGTWLFEWDDDAIYLTSIGLKCALESSDRRVMWVGILNTREQIPEEEQDGVQAALLTKFNCVPVFAPTALLAKFYTGFCKSVLWPLFHMATEAPLDTGPNIHFDRGLWQVYTMVNRKFADVVVSMYQGEHNLIWIHDYHLMMLPIQLRRKLTGARIGFYLHIPWPPSDVYRMLPVRDELLRSLLCSSLLGFNLFDYARHFLSCCTRLLDLDHHMKNGNINIEYAGRTSVIRVSHIGINPSRFTDILNSERVTREEERLHDMTRDAKIIGAIDDLDLIKGIPFKLLAFEKLLINFPHHRDQLVLYQVAIPRGVPTERALKEEIYALVDRINDDFGTDDYIPVIYVEKRLTLVERLALYRASDAFLLTPIRDGLNLIPYEFLICAKPGKGRLILSEFTGCWKALFSAVRVNPWNLEEIMYTIDITLNEDEAQAIEEHRADIRHIQKHTISRWAMSFVSDLEVIEESSHRHHLNLGLGVNPGLIELEDLQFIDPSILTSRFLSAEKRFIFIEYDGALVHSSTKPSAKALNALNVLSEVPGCFLYVSSSQRREALQEIFANTPGIGLVAESGFYVRFPLSNEWKTVLSHRTDLSWIDAAREIVEGYCERTDGSYLEENHGGLVWHYANVDATFGSWQARELNDHLHAVLGAFDFELVHGDGWLQIRTKELARLTLEAVWNHMNQDTSAVTDGIHSLMSAEGSNSLGAPNNSSPIHSVSGSGLHIIKENEHDNDDDHGVAMHSKSPQFVFAVGGSRADDSIMACLNAKIKKSHVVSAFTCTVNGRPATQFYMHNSHELTDVLAFLSQACYNRSLSTHKISQV